MAVVVPGIVVVIDEIVVYVGADFGGEIGVEIVGASIQDGDQDTLALRGGPGFGSTNGVQAPLKPKVRIVGIDRWGRRWAIGAQDQGR